jgi:multiple sugar transport system substrate-binding protein
MNTKLISRRDVLRTGALGAGAAVLAACAPAALSPSPSTSGTSASAAPPSGGPGSSTPPTGYAPPDPNTTAKLTVLTYGNANDQSRVAGANIRFKQRFPNVTIDTIFNPIKTWGEYNAKILALVAAGQVPDVITVAIEGSRRVVKDDLMHPLDDYLAKDPSAADLTRDVHPTLFNALKVNDKTYLAPFDWNNMVIFYNTKIFTDMGVPFPQAGWTWDDFLDAAKKTTTAAHFGFGLPYFNFGMTPWWITNGTYEVTGDWQHSNLNDPKMAEAATFIRDLVTLHKVSPAPAGVDIYNLFPANKLAMIGGGGWPIGGLKAAGNKNYDVVEWPKKAASGTVIGVGGYGISKATTQKDLGWELVKEYTSAATIAETLAGGGMPVRRSIIEGPVFLAEPKNAGLFEKSLDTAKPVAAPWFFNDLERLVLRAMDEILSGAKTPQQALLDAHNELETVIAAG